MKYGIINLAAVACRAEASHKSEQINQLLFGDLYSVTEESTDWIKVKAEYDNYEGWIHRKHHADLTAKEFRSLKSVNAAVTLDLLGQVKNKEDKFTTSIPVGSSLRNPAFSYKGKKAKAKRANVFSYALLYLNAPYLWGGKTPFGIDCSGFMQIVHKLAGIKLPRDSSQQALVGKQVKNLAAAKKGDLCFFGDGEKVTHVGMLLSSNTIIHASGQVRIDGIDAEGIFPEESGTYTHKLKSIRRI
jgi:cell wall-associated NlpC family hydrolase